MKRNVIALAVSLILLVACNSKPTTGSYPPDGGDNLTPAPSGGGSTDNTPYPVPDNSNATGATATPYPAPGSSAETPASSGETNTGSPYPDPLLPVPGEENMKRGEVFIDESGIVTQESMPPKYVLHIVGNLPTPCHKLRANLSQPDDQNQIKVEVFSLVNPDEICTQVLSPFDSNVALGSYQTGKYSVLLNGQKIGEIDAP